MKVKPLFSYSEGVLTDAEGNARAASVESLRIDDFSASLPLPDMAALAAKGANVILLRVPLNLIAPAPDSFNEAALARLREILKNAEECRVAAILSIEDASADELFISAAEHAARRLKDCASLIGLATPKGAGEGFLLELEARFEKKHPTLLFFVPTDEKDGESAKRLSHPFVALFVAL